MLKISPLTRETASLAVTVTFPAFPVPKVDALSTAPLVSESEPALMAILPPVPFDPGFTLLKIPLGNAPLPSRVAAPETFTVTLPASPCPADWVLEALRINVSSPAPLDKKREPELISILPPFPTPPASTVLKI